jgi:ADP-ribose pyrophosphatase YjhB (NUDIX family)
MPEDVAVRMVRKMTGLDVRIVREYATFIQEGTPTGTMLAHCYIARITGGALIHDGPEGPARAFLTRCRIGPPPFVGKVEGVRRGRPAKEETCPST